MLSPLYRRGRRSSGLYEDRLNVILRRLARLLCARYPQTDDDE
jgi:hypothetical protein